MCGPALAWDGLVLDLAFVLAFTSSGAVLRARRASPLAWAVFASVGVGAGALLFGGAYLGQALASEPKAAGDAVTLLASC